MNAPDYAPQPTVPELRRIDRIRHATRRRTRRTRRRMHRPVFAVVALTIALLVPLLAYACLAVNLTSLNYAVARADRERTALLEESQRLDNQIVRLKSPERLAAIAAALKMHDPHVYAVVTLPEPKAQPRPTGIALLGAWLHSR